ncbi:hypothetical protein GUITHDRAFT_104470 [Guillardia theta CCMP2712]|uniref:Uncharacterized protein n=1 Tax=Guillardia theta (strain CCMP2712) TaxID=905079 RepID=L1JPE7_GUITC|nr:hypothetical protein GUITHDRAFT_104470 [Guillardia theta CCMP2712]EKX50075.1 hypothetical protein GUITHDRAFT_104470 [Guillardia theta CCMP2712]|eukprot:XP_005837055.1 hypothetical protein GUITHDRAFT_104470 [Guillardia theta CCMP2712]
MSEMRSAVRAVMRLIKFIPVQDEAGKRNLMKVLRDSFRSPSKRVREDGDGAAGKDSQEEGIKQVAAVAEILVNALAHRKDPLAMQDMMIVHALASGAGNKVYRDAALKELIMRGMGRYGEQGLEGESTRSVQE